MSQSASEGPSPEPEDIRQRMAFLRGQLGGEVDGIVENARTLADWKYYAKAYPWGALGAAVAVGYLAIPRRLEVIRPDAETLAQLARTNNLVVTQQAETKPKSSMIGSALHVVSNAVLRAGMAYLGQQVGKVVGNEAADSNTDEYRQQFAPGSPPR